MKQILFLGNEQYGAETLKSVLGILDAQNYVLHIGAKQLDKHIKKVIAKCSIPKEQIHILRKKVDVENLCKKLKPYVCLTASFGLILTKETLKTSKLGFLNFHPSLLPKLRGPSPIRSSILQGFRNSGVTVYKMNEKMDAGSIIAQDKFTILSTDYYDDVFIKVNEATKGLLATVFFLLNDNKPWPLKDQSEQDATYCNKIFDWNGYITFNETRGETDRKVRALSTNPGVCFLANGKRMFIRKAIPWDLQNKEVTIKPKFMLIKKKDIFLTFKNFELKIAVIQVEGKKSMKVRDFCNGWRGEKIIPCDVLNIPVAPEETAPHSTENTYIVVDVESDGNLLGVNSLVCFGAVVVDENLDKVFYGRTKPISKVFNPEALAVTGFSREEHESFPNPEKTMKEFAKWLKEQNIVGRRLVLLSDNNEYDASWINYYLLKYVGVNPFGYSSRRITDLFCGFYKKSNCKWKQHRITPHTHDPVDDAKGNAEAILYLIKQGFKLI